MAANEVASLPCRSAILTEPRAVAPILLASVAIDQYKTALSRKIPAKA
jgi:predicted methyltransferase MtxX (methanogen marker protein 4)